MSRTKIFRDQHDELIKIAGELSEYLSLEKVKTNADEIRHLLSKLFGKLNVHLSMEDKS